VAVSEPEPGQNPPPAGPLLRLIKDQRVAFVIVGAVNTGVGLVWFVLFHALIGGVVGYMGTLVFAHVFAVLSAFFLHRRFVFKVRGHLGLDLLRFEIVNLGALAANAALLPLFVEVVGLEVLPAQFLATAITVVGSYLGHNLFSFRRKHPRQTGSPHR
jgi:putative flippase GtrA